MCTAPVVVLQPDSRAALRLRVVLQPSFSAVYHASSVDEASSMIARYRAGFAVLDTESASLRDVDRLTREFPATVFICTHRLADEQMWAEALNAGAADLCSAQDTSGILRALRLCSADMGAVAA